MIIILFFILGLIFGSFINCLVYRLKSKKTILGRSFCPQCKHQLGFWDLIPLFSFIFLKRKCRYCQKKIAGQYFLAELFTGFIFALGYWFYFLAPQANFNFLALGFYLVISVFLLIIFIYDFKYYLIPDIIVWPAIIIALGFNLLLGLGIGNLLLAGLIGLVFFGFQYFISKGKWIGEGDILLGILVGFIVGWPQILLTLFISYILGSIIGIILIFFKKKNWSSQIPFGPFLVLGIWMSIFLGDYIIKWCFSLY